VGGTVLQRRYLIDRLLGGGGMGMVYLARDQRLSDRPCAIKEMVDHFIDPNQRIEANEYFAREADTLAQLKHPAIPAISDRFDDQNRHYLVMEYVQGRNLEEELAVRGGPLPEGLILDVARQLCDVLAYLHGLQPPLIYRDMKPSNVMLTAEGRAVLVDFGIARLFKAQGKGTMIGTLGFAPPEQYQGVADPRSDIYSLGATLHYILTGRDPEKFPPFSFPPVRELRPDAARNLAGAIDRALAYDMRARPATIGELRDMLLYGRGLDGANARASAQSGTADLSQSRAELAAAEGAFRPARRTRRRRRRVTFAMLTLALGGLAFGATYVYRDPGIQARLGLTSYINQLPWKHDELLAAARAHPLEFEQLSLALSTREGDPLGAPRASFTDLELTTNPYLKWTASCKNRLAGLDSQAGQVEAHFYDPAGTQIALSTNQRFVGPGQTAVDFSGVALIPPTSAIAPGDYRISLYSDGQLLGEQRFTVSEDLAAKAAGMRAKAEAEAVARAAEAKHAEETRRLALLEARMRQPLQLENIEFLNTTKDGTALSGPLNVFSVSRVLFVGWRTVFQNRLAGLNDNQYRVDAAYLAPDGSTLGSVDDVQAVPRGQARAVFSGRVGNAAGGAFLPGQYTVNFYLNGQYFAQRKFRIEADAGSPYTGAPSSGGGYASGSYSGGSATGLDLPTLASGSIDGIGGSGSAGLELRLRPQSNGFLHGEMVVSLAGYGPAPIEGFVRGDRIQFEVPYGGDTVAFKGLHNGDLLSGTFEATPSGAHGTWSARAN
jgi:hypothetical protein